MRPRRCSRAAALALGLAIALLTANAHADDSAKIYLLPGVLALGGAAAIIGGAVSISDPEPDTVWTDVGYAMSALNIMSGSVLITIGAAGAGDSASTDEMHLIMGVSQVGLALVDVFVAALADGHYDAIRQLKEQRLGVGVAPVGPTGALLSVNTAF